MTENQVARVVVDAAYRVHTIEALNFLGLAGAWHLS